MAATLTSLLLLYVLNARPSLGADENAYQQFIGCAFNSRGQVGHFWRYGYNSKDIMYIDLVREAMVSTSETGHFLTEERKSVEYIKSKEKRLRKLCTAVQTVFSLSNNSLSRAVKPAVHVKLREEKGREFLLCLVHGFYPNVIRVRWTRDGKNIYYGTSTTGVLPHKDGTFQMTNYLSLSNTSVHGVTCEIEHISIDGKMRATLEETPSLLLSVVLAAAAFFAGIAFPVGTVTLIIRLRRKQKPKDTTNDSSEASTPPSVSLMHLQAES
ncbi:major histocompatibility complex class I-related gene protein [Colossoma macropomum]|uniref:major histocompatibility complex class I-related gene protein n=1 Tax=Colossoma macropomum TaxID=42526 RepID=UPI001864CD93|nr:major histocompatibility complex class I-related gene protein [Colossoma macropomum]